MGAELAKIKTIVIDRIIVLTAILIFPAYVLSMLRWIETGYKFIYIIHTVIYILIVFLLIYRKKLSYSVKISLIAVFFLIVAIAGLMGLALSGGHYYIIIAMAILTILVKRKYTIMVTVFMFIVYSIIAYAFVNGYIKPILDLNSLPTRVGHWATSILSVFSLIIIFIYGFGDFYHQLTETIISRKKTFDELTDSNQKLEISEKKYQLLFELANDGICLLKNGKLYDCNQKFCEIYRATKDQLIGIELHEISTDIQQDGKKSKRKWEESITLAIKGESQVSEWSQLNFEGKVFYASISISNIKLPNEDIVQCVVRDISDRIVKDAELEVYRNELEIIVRNKTADLEQANNCLLEANKLLSEKNNLISIKNEELNRLLEDLQKTQVQLITSAKMASLGVLTAGITHEINNPLNFIMGSYVGLKSRLKNSREISEQDYVKIQELLDSLKIGIDRTTTIVNGINQLSRTNKEMNEECNLVEIINNSIVVMKSKSSDKIKTNFVYDPNLKYILTGNVGEIHQLAINLLSNAIDAIVESGQIDIYLKKLSNSISLEITDNGIGIEKQNLDKILDPFFTTKDPGKGTGLGLAISYNIVKKHRGKIEFESEPNKGTKVSVVFSEPDFN